MYDLYHVKERIIYRVDVNWKEKKPRSEPSKLWLNALTTELLELWQWSRDRRDAILWFKSWLDLIFFSFQFTSTQ